MNAKTDTTTSEDVRSFVDFCETDFGKRIIDEEAQFLKERIPSDALVLDIGSGIGSVEERMSYHDVIGVDASRPMVEESKRRTEAEYVLGDATELPFEDSSFDAVFSVATLEFLHDVDSTLREVRRVLGPDGNVVFLLLNPESGYVRSRIGDEDSYFSRMVHRDLDSLVRTVSEYFDVEHTPLLGIDRRAQEVSETDDFKDAAVVSVTGET